MHRSGPAYDVSFLAERHDPAAGAVWTSEVVRTHGLAQADAHGLWVRVDGGSDEVTLDSNKHGSQIEARERLLVAGRDIGIGDLAGARDDTSDQPTHGIRLLNLPYRDGIKHRSGAPEIILEPSREWLLGEAVERRGKLAVAERLDEIGDVQAQKPDEEGVFLRRLNGFAFVDGIAN